MRKIAIIGAQHIAIIFAKRMKELGIESHCFSWEKDEFIGKYVDYFYPISIFEKERILKKCKEIGINGIIATTELTISISAYIAEKLGLNGNSYFISKEITNKYKNRKKIEGIIELKQPRYAIIQDYNDILNLNVNFPIILKPTSEGGKRGVIVVNNSQELKEAYFYVKSACKNIDSQILVEEYLDGGIECSVESLSFHGKNYIVQITEKDTSGPPHCVELGHHQPANISQDTKEKIIKGVDKALKKLGIINGPCHTEIKIINKDIYIIEFNARLGGDKISYPLTELSTGYPYITAVLKIALDEFEGIEIDKLENNYAGIYFITEQTKKLKEIFENCEKYEWFYKKHKISDTLDILTQNRAESLNYFIYFSKNEKPKF